MSSHTSRVASLISGRNSSFLHDDVPFELTSNVPVPPLPPTFRDPVPPPPPSFQDPVPPLPPSFTWNEDQLAAIDQILAWRSNAFGPKFMKLTGAAGAGKTTVLRALKERFGRGAAWAAMTGKAASRMRELAQVRASTLHSALYHGPREVDNAVEQRIDLEFRDVKVGFASLLTLDESSMCSPRIFEDLNRSTFQKVLLVGDPYQLSPVLSRQEEGQHGEDYSVFKHVEGPHLGRVMRNQGAVLGAATLVREKQIVPEHSMAEGGSIYNYSEALDPNSAIDTAVDKWFSDPKGHVLVTWKNDNRMTANETIRKRLGHTDRFPVPGEPVVVRKNVHSAGIMNGDVVEVVEWLDEGPTLCGIPTRYLRVKVDLGAMGSVEVTLLVPTATFDGTMPYVPLADMRRATKQADCGDPVPVTFAYCLTGHSIQGSEFRRVTTFIPGDFRSKNFTKPTTLPDGTSMPFSMRFLYVAISRAKERADLIVSR